MGGMGNQDGGDEDFRPQRRRNCEEEEKEEAKEKKRFMGPVGGWRSLCVRRRAGGTGDAEWEGGGVGEA